MMYQQTKIPVKGRSTEGANARALQLKCKACLEEDLSNGEGTSVQRMVNELPEEEEMQLKRKAPAVQRKNRTGIPDRLKTGMEATTGYNLDHVRVHYNSPKPAAVQAHAYAQGSEVHLSSGQEKHLPHELGHVVQQMEGRVKANTSVNGVAVNDSPRLEREADRMGARAMKYGG